MIRRGPGASRARDSVELDLEQGKIRRIDGFFGPLPAVGTANIG
jgi:hypothetical protein